MVVIIPTYEQPSLLRRTLLSLQDCDLPEPTRIVVVENGRRAGAEEIVDEFRGRFRIEYLFSEGANKSRALNLAIRGIDDALCVFFDDDVRIHPQTLRAYERAAAELGSGTYYVGATSVDYEVTPNSWIIENLPTSAVGWQPYKERHKVDQPLGMGFNWAARSADLHALGGFDERYGPGSGARGQESNMYQRLLASGVAAYYLPDALVWHYVPEARSTEDWIVKRAVEHGRTVGRDSRSAGEARVMIAAKAAKGTAVASLRWFVEVALRRPGKRLYWRRMINFHYGTLLAA